MKNNNCNNYKLIINLDSILKIHIIYNSRYIELIYNANFLTKNEINNNKKTKIHKFNS